MLPSTILVKLSAVSLYHKKMLRWVNTVLLILIIAINGYVIFLPLLPAVNYRLQQSTKSAQFEHKLEQSPRGNQTNSLIAPAMLLDAPILESPASQAYATLNKGIWRLNKGSTPEKGGNTVLIGHRFTYTNPNGVFYHLDKLKVGNKLAVIWNHTKYVYSVRSVLTTPASSVEIEAPTQQAQLTLYTCTPLWLPKDRLVVIADLEQRP